jgi:hypothetical protein
MIKVQGRGANGWHCWGERWAVLRRERRGHGGQGDSGASGTPGGVRKNMGVLVGPVGPAGPGQGERGRRPGGLNVAGPIGRVKEFFFSLLEMIFKV